MKTRIDCTKCRIEIYKEAEKEYLKHQYAWFKDSAVTFATYSTVAALAVMHRRGRSKEYIQKFFEDLCFMYDYPAYMGEPLKMTDMMNTFQKEYGIDFSKITVHIESEKAFIDSVVRRKKDKT